MAIILVPMLLLACIRNLKYLSPVSMLANILQFSGLGIIFYYVLQDLPYSWERKPFASWGQLPLYFGTAIYAFEVEPLLFFNHCELKYKQIRGGFPLKHSHIFVYAFPNIPYS